MQLLYLTSLQLVGGISGVKSNNLQNLTSENINVEISLRVKQLRFINLKLLHKLHLYYYINYNSIICNTFRGDLTTVLTFKKTKLKKVELNKTQRSKYIRRETFEKCYTLLPTYYCIFPISLKIILYLTANICINYVSLIFRPLVIIRKIP